MTSHRRILARWASASALLAAALVIALPQQAAAQAKKDSVVLGMVLEPAPGLDPTVAPAAAIGEVVHLSVLEGLTKINMDGKITPLLAESWSTDPDGKVYTFKLKKGVKFHDGEAFDASDVKFSFERAKAPGSTNKAKKAVFDNISSIDTPDPQTVIVILNNADGNFLFRMGENTAVILDPKSAPTTATRPIGTGPFKFGAWERGQYVRLDRNPNYWQKGLPYLDRIVARFIPDASTRSAALEAGEAQYAGYSAVNYADVKRLQANPALDTTTKGYEMAAGLSEIEMNAHRPPFDKREVRQAIAYAIDRNFIIDNVQYGFGKPATGPISSNFKASGLYTDDVMKFDVPDRIAIANKLLDDAGLPRKDNGMRFSTTLEVNPFGQQWLRQAEYLKQALAAVGIDLSLRSEDVGAWLRRVYTNYDYDMSEPFFLGLSDPVIGVQRQYVTGQIRKGVDFVNNTFYSNKEVDDLFAAGAQELDPAKRAEIYHKIQKILVTDSPVIWLTEVQYVTVFNRKLHDATTNPLGTYSAFERAWIEH